MYRDKRGLPETQRQDSSAACYVIVFFDCRNSQLFEEAGRGAAGPLISHSWLTVMTDFSCPRASVFKSFHTQPATHSHNWLPKSKVMWTASLGEVYSGKRVLLWNQQEYTAQRQREAAWRILLLLHWYTVYVSGSYRTLNGFWSAVSLITLYNWLIPLWLCSA